jgi:hypothetical protein
MRAFVIKREEAAKNLNGNYVDDTFSMKRKPLRGKG